VQFGKHFKQFAALMMVMMFAVSASGPLGLVGTAAATRGCTARLDDDGDTEDARWWDLRPPLDDDG
jgi:hypothetical protein